MSEFHCRQYIDNTFSCHPDYFMFRGASLVFIKCFFGKSSVDWMYGIIAAAAAATTTSCERSGSVVWH